MINLNLQIERFLNYCKSRKALNDKTIKAYRIDLDNSLNIQTIHFPKERFANTSTCFTNDSSPRR